MLQEGMEGLGRIRGFSDTDLADALVALAASERRAIALLVAALAEFDARRLYLGLGYSSLFAYCTDALHLSEQASFNRIEAARLSRRLPIVLDCIADGTLSLTGARLLAPHLTDENQRDVIAEARHKKTREIEQLVARIRPLPPAPTVIRRVPVKRGVAAAELPSPARQLVSPASDQPATAPSRPRVTPLSETTYRVQVTISADAHNLLREAQQLLRHALPNGDAAAIVERALQVLVAQLRRAKFGEASRPMTETASASKGRHIPASVKRAVAARDGHRCAFVSEEGRRCEETGFLEYHHVVPYARGGAAAADNIELRCRGHNVYEAELVFGAWERG